MKYAFSICCLILSLFAATGCSKDKDDEPGSNGGSLGTCKVDGKSFSLNFGYMTEENDFISLMFTDSDLFKYIESDGSLSPNIVLSFLAIDLEYSGTPEYLEIGYKSNYSNKGYGYFLEDEDELDKISLSLSGKKVKAKASDITVEGIDIVNDKELGTSTASFSINGNVINLTGNDQDDYTRSIPVTKVTDSKHIEILKSLRSSRPNVKSLK